MGINAQAQGENSARESIDVSKLSEEELAAAINDLIAELSKAGNQTEKTLFGMEEQGVNSVEDIMDNIERRTPIGLKFVGLHLEVRRIEKESKPRRKPPFFRLRMAQLRQKLSDPKGKDGEKSYLRGHLERMAKGENPYHDDKQGVREALYPGWENEDFQDALNELDGEPGICTRTREGIALLIDGIINFIETSKLGGTFFLKTEGKNDYEAKASIIKELKKIKNPDREMVFGLKRTITVTELILSLESGTALGSQFARRCREGYNMFEKRLEHFHDHKEIGEKIRSKLAKILT